jgi:hypothetical protein
LGIFVPFCSLSFSLIICFFQEAVKMLSTSIINNIALLAIKLYNVAEVKGGGSTCSTSF